MDPVAGLVIVRDLRRSLRQPKRQHRVKPVFLDLVLGRVARATGWPVEALRHMVPKSHFARPSASQKCDLPGSHWRAREGWQDRLATALLISPEAAEEYRVSQLVVSDFGGTVLHDVLLACRMSGIDATELLLAGLEQGDLRRMVNLYLGGHAFTWYASWYAYKIQELLAREAAFYAALS